MMGKPLSLLLLLALGTQALALDSLDVFVGDPEAALDSSERSLSASVSLHQVGVASTLEGETALTGFVSTSLVVTHDRWAGGLHFDDLRNAGTFFRRVMEAGWDHRGESGRNASRWRARWDWQPLPSVGVAIGRDTLSEGWGLRSLFRGRHNAPTPFAQIALDGGGRLRYRHRIEALQGDRHIDCWTGAEGDPRTWVPPSGPIRAGIERMVVSHRVEVDFGRRLTGALWGAVVWNIEDGARAFEPHYLMPLTSLRPTEYAQGSSDNALVGVEGRIKLGQDWGRRPRTLYGQFLLDELIVSELLGGTQWWGNKFAALGGLRWDTRWGGWQWEVSAARPWTYSHFTRTAAYLNGITPLAHPLGANFVETAWAGHWQAGAWQIHARLTASIRGDDPTGETPTGSLPQVGDIQRTEDQYAWLNGTQRRRTVAFLDVARDLQLADDVAITAYVQAAVGRETAPLDGLAPEREMWIGLGLRSSGPFFGADW